MSGHSEGLTLLAVFNYACHWTSKYIRRLCRHFLGQRQLTTFDMIPGDVLLEIFDLYVHEDMNEDMKQSVEKWIRLVHVCRRWRNVVFQSPLRLDLRLFCIHKTPAMDNLDIWPTLPLIINDYNNYDSVGGLFADNRDIIAALEHNDRVCKIQLTYGELGYFTNSATILKPFPELKFLWLNHRNWNKEPESMLPHSFLGGSAPHLRSLHLDNVSFLGLPKLLLSTTHLVHLILSSIPRSGYIPPEAIATSLSALTSLEFVHLWFSDPPPRPALETRRPSLPPLTHIILPSLTKFEFRGTSEYSEAILAMIDAPLLGELDITYFNQLIFDTPQLFQFTNRRPTLRTSEKGYIEFRSRSIDAKFPSQTSDYDVLSVRIWCNPSEWQLSSLGQVCNSSFPPVSVLETLYIYEDRYLKPLWQDDVENTLWLDLLRPFAAVKNLYISVAFVPRIAPALQELVGGRTTEVLPALDNIFMEGFQQSGPLQEGIEKFVAARLLTSRPVAVSHWDTAREKLW